MFQPGPVVRETWRPALAVFTCRAMLLIVHEILSRQPNYSLCACKPPR